MQCRMQDPGGARRALLTTTRIVDFQCGTAVTADTEAALKRIGWL